MSTQSIIAMTRPGGGLKDDRDPVAFTELLRKSRSRVFGYLLALVQNSSDAEDLYQHTALVLWEKFDQFDATTDFGTWATTVAHYSALNFLRRQSRRRVLFNEAVLARLAEVQETLRDDVVSARSDALTRCLDILSSNHRRLLKLRYHGDHSMQEIARREGRTVGALYVALSRIRKSLLTCIEQRIQGELA